MNRTAKYFPLLIVFLALGCIAIAPGAVLGVPDDASTDPAKYSGDWRTTGPPGGDVRALVVDPNNADRFYFGTISIIGIDYQGADISSRGTRRTPVARVFGRIGGGIVWDAQNGSRRDSNAPKSQEDNQKGEVLCSSIHR